MSSMFNEIIKFQVWSPRSTSHPDLCGRVWRIDWGRSAQPAWNALECLWRGFGMSLWWCWTVLRMALESLWDGFGMRLGGFGMHLELLRNAFGMASECTWNGFGILWEWLWNDFRMALECTWNCFEMH